ncbi:MAG: site-2 protease family protein [Polyangiaceae bacterium]|nr:site-2 protease family protein [Polyangiaceae bacterium]
MYVIVAILGLAVLMIVHEAGHYFAARASGLRVLKFSIGFGPTLFKILPEDGFWMFSSFGDRAKFKLFKHDPEKHGPTVFQVAVIPFLAYVQIAGMNPLEENDPNDKGSYANAGLWARVVTIFAGPLANYLAASLFFFVPLYASNSSADPADPTMIMVVPDTPAARAGLQDNDVIIAIDGDNIHGEWKKMSEKIVGSEGKPLTVTVLRGETQLDIQVTPELKGEDKRPRIGVGPRPFRPAKNFGEIALGAVTYPPQVVKEAMAAFKQWARREGDAQLAGPVRMVDTMADAVKSSWIDFLFILGKISTSLAVFNLLPIPALDGGRLLFLGYEATTRRRPNPTVEAHIHAICLLMMLGLMAYVTLANDLGFGGSK